MKIKECCEKFRENSCAFRITEELIGSTFIETDSLEISTCEDHYYSLEDVKFCPFCGKKFKLIQNSQK